jgi:hypothetical protein
LLNVCANKEASEHREEVVKLSSRGSATLEVLDTIRLPAASSDLVSESVRRVQFGIAAPCDSSDGPIDSLEECRVSASHSLWINGSTYREDAKGKLIIAHLLFASDLSDCERVFER